MEHEIKEILEWMTGHGFGVTDAIGLLSIIAALTPTPVDNAVLGLIKAVINVGAGNWGGARNEKKPKLPDSLGKVLDKMRKNQ